MPPRCRCQNRAICVKPVVHVNVAIVGDAKPAMFQSKEDASISTIQCASCTAGIKGVNLHGIKMSTPAAKQAA